MGNNTNYKPNKFIKPIEKIWLLIITRFGQEVKRVTQQKAQIRNQLMLQIADNIVVGYISPGGWLEKQFHHTPKKYCGVVKNSDVKYFSFQITEYFILYFLE